MRDRREYHANYMRNKRKNEPEKVRQADRNYALKLRQRVLDFYGKSCENCGCSVEEILELNHINGGGRSEARLIGTKSLYRKALKLEERTNYNLLCRVCNAAHYVGDLLGIKGHSITWSPAV